MDELDRQLERLRTLRDSGALTDAEYELEKARLSGPPPLAPQPSSPPSAEPPPPPPPAADPAARRFNPWLVIAPLAAIAIALLTYFLIVGRGQQSTTVAVNGTQANSAAAASAPAAPAGPTMRDRPEAEQLATAFRAVFGRDGPVPRDDLGGEGGTERAARLLWTSFGPVLLTESSLPDGCHVCAGYVGAYYLRDTGSGFEVAARYPEAAPGSSWGNPPEAWRMVDNFTTHPALYYEGGYTGQGNTSLFAHLVELKPTGPVDSTIDLGFDNSGAVGDEGEAEGYQGEIRNVVKDRGFDVVYTGSCAFTRRYVLRGESYQPETDAVPECAN